MCRPDRSARRLALLVVCWPLATPALSRPPAPPRGDVTIAELIEQLGDDRFANREAAQKKLERIGAPAGPAVLRAAWRHPDIEVRARARQFVSRVYLRHIPSLIKLLGHDEFSDREAAQRILVQIGPPAIPYLRQAARDSPDFEVVWRARRALRSIQGE